MNVGKYKKRRTCRSCGSKSFRPVLDMGIMPHAGDFLTKEELGKERYYPLKIWQCKKCGLIQILDVIAPVVLFKDYHYLSSITLTKHFEEYAEEMFSKFLSKNSFAVDIGSNDGVLLSPLEKLGVKALGVDPAVNIVKVARAKGLKTIIGEFNTKVAKNIVQKYGKADAIFANNVLAHIDDIKAVFRGAKILLKKDGIMVCEVHYLPHLMGKLQYDFFYNEHLNYYSLTTFSQLLKQFGIVPFDVKKIPIHSGSMRVYSKFEGNKKFKKTEMLMKVLEEEKNMNKYVDMVLGFDKRVKSHKKNLNSKLKRLKAENYKIVGYGASGRGNTLLNYCGIGKEMIDYIVDESPERYGKLTPGTNIPIVKPEVFRRDKNVKFVLLLAWNYKDEIIKKEDKFISSGGVFILPFPKVRIYP